jgi:hypothetical protein
MRATTNGSLKRATNNGLRLLIDYREEAQRMDHVRALVKFAVPEGELENGC